jgi:hypothetical protein
VFAPCVSPGKNRLMGRKKTPGATKATFLLTTQKGDLAAPPKNGEASPLAIGNPKGTARSTKPEVTKRPEVVPPSFTLPPIETAFLNDFVSVPLPTLLGSGNDKPKAIRAAEDACVSQAVSILTRFNMCILHNALTPEDVEVIREEFLSLLDFTGDSAIGEKDASKRSGTRMYNCKCQVGPA